MLRAAVIGLGVGEQHLAGYEKHPESAPVAICDVDPDRLAEVSARHPGLRATTDPAAILEADDIDVVSVASYDHAHFDQIVTALRAGKHVFAEKPLVQELAQAIEIRRVLRESDGLRLSTNVPLRRSPRFIGLRERIAAGELGPIFHAEGDYDYGRRHKLTAGWRGREPRYSVMLGGGIHLIDLLMWLTGDRPARVEGVAANRIATAGTAFEDFDLMVALLTCASGATWKIAANLGSVSPHFHAVRIYGRDATWMNGLPDAVLYRSAQAEGATIEPDSSPYPGVHKGDLIAPFIQSILTGEDCGVAEDDVFAALSVCFAIELALDQERPVEVEYL